MMRLMRLIDANALCDYLENISHTILDEDHLYGTGLFDMEIAVAIQKQKTVDAVPVVRCKECKKKENCKFPATWNWCPDGERKEKTDDSTKK